MLQRKFFAACVLLVVASIATYAKNIHKKTSVVRPSQPPGACDDDRVKCPNSDRCIRPQWFCDGYNDCGDASDEEDCPTRICPSYSTKCPTKNLCIPSYKFCDGYNHCSDNSDEPEDCRTRTCPEGQLKCKSGQCIDSSAYCDGYLECRDRTQFPDFICPDVTCNTGYVKCPRKSRCIKSNYFCDTDNDCGDLSDEPADCSERSCQPSEFKCGNGRCLNRTALCLSAESYGCRDNTDITNLCSDFPCPTGYFKCVSDGKCTANSNLCDGSADCSDSSDESLNNCANHGNAHLVQHFNPYSPSDRKPSAKELSCLMALTQMHETCSIKLNTWNVELGGGGMKAARDNVVAMDLSDLCRPAQGVLECFRSVLSPCAGVDNPMLDEVKLSLSVGERMLEYVCVQQIDVFNRNKACLLRDDGSDSAWPELTLLDTLGTSCGREQISYCSVSDYFHGCAKNVVVAQCGDEVAGALSGLANLVTETAGCKNALQSRSLRNPHKHNRGFSIYKRT